MTKRSTQKNHDVAFDITDVYPLNLPRSHFPLPTTTRSIFTTTAMSIAARLVRPTARAVSTRGLTIAAVRQKHTLPALKYDYAELEPSISGQIMEVCGAEVEQCVRGALTA